MNKLPTKQIYLLVIIIVGIIALSIYSTFAIFTFDINIDKAVSIKLPSVLEISSDLDEYKQLELPKETNKIADIDIYNTFDYDLCYSIWYKVIGDEKEVEIYELSDDNLTTSGIVLPKENYRVKLLLINNSNKKVYVNIGLATMKNDSSCNLNLSTDKKLIKNYYGKDITYLNETIINEKNKIKEEIENNYITYSNINNTEIYDLPIEIYSNFELTDTGFKLNNLIQEKEFNFQNNKYYFCKEEPCKNIFEILDATYEEEKLKINKYNILDFYEKGNSGLKQVENNYYYYGSNPSNYIYFNCEKDSCELWRIIGVFYDEETKKYNTKIVRNDYLEKKEYSNNSSNDWQTSSLYKFLHDEYIINDTSKKYVIDYKYTYELLEDINEPKYQIKKIDNASNMTILTLSDYLNTSSNKDNYLEKNWLKKNTLAKEWILTLYNEIQKQEELEEDIINYQVLTNDFKPNNPSEKFYIRPVVYLKDRVLLSSGNGTIDNPYKIN